MKIIGFISLMVLLLLMAMITVVQSAPAQTIQLDQIRNSCETLTNSDFKDSEGYTLMSRKGIMIKQVVRLCEQIEMSWDEKKDLSAAQNQIEKLNLIYASFIDRHRIDQGVNFFDIIKMGLAHDLSPFYLQVLKDKNPSKTDQNIKDNIFWHEPQRPLNNEFLRQSENLQVDRKLKWLRIDKLEGKGSVPKVHGVDIRNGVTWLLKWGDEVHTDPVASRIFAALGFNVDLPGYYKPDEIMLIFGRQKKDKRDIHEIVHFMFNKYKVNLSPFIHDVNVIDSELVTTNPSLQSFIGETYVRLSGVAIEPRPEIENRLGGIMTSFPSNQNRLELRGALLAHLWIGSWDVKEDNTLLSIIESNNDFSLRGSFSDLGVSLGVLISKFPRDLKAGLVNEFSWNLITIDDNKIKFQARMNFHPATFQAATFQDLKWMAGHIANISPEELTEILIHSGWPHYIQKLYFFKLAERRRQILLAFEVKDPFQYDIDKNYSYEEKGRWLVKNGELVVEPDIQLYPEGLLHKNGRFRGYGWNP